MKKKALICFIAVAVLISAFSLHVMSVKRPESYIWILEANGESTTKMRGKRTDGITVTYDLDLRYISLSGSSLTQAQTPTRFTGAATLNAKYDYSTVPKISRLLYAMDNEPELVSTSCLRTQRELPNFELGYDGELSTHIDFDGSELSYNDSEYVKEILGNYSSGAIPSMEVEGEKKSVSIYLNAASREFEIGKDSDYGVRSVAVLETVYGSSFEKDVYSFELTGTLKRVVYSPENLYSILMSPSSKKLPELAKGTEEKLELLNLERTVSRIRAALSGGVYWPEGLPESLPEFDEADKIVAVSSSNGVVYVTAECTWGQFNEYRKRLCNSEGYYSNGSDIYSADCYIKTTAKNLSKYKINMTLEIYLPAKDFWLEGFEVFPIFEYGCILKTPFGEGTPKKDNNAWMNVQAYGANDDSFISYGKQLEEKGFKYDLDEYILVGADGYRYSFSMSDFTDEFGSGKLLTFYISKDVKEEEITEEKGEENKTTENENTEVAE